MAGASLCKVIASFRMPPHLAMLRHGPEPPPHNLGHTLRAPFSPLPTPREARSRLCAGAPPALPPSAATRHLAPPPPPRAPRLVSTGASWRHRGRPPRPT
eukprot:scaffold101374_cov36-Phaeocystis_antarctica.AAC.1